MSAFLCWEDTALINFTPAPSRPRNALPLSLGGFQRELSEFRNRFSSSVFGLLQGRSISELNAAL